MREKIKKSVGCAKSPLENNPLCIWGLHIRWHRVESKHQNGNRCCSEGELLHTGVYSMFSSVLALSPALSSSLAKHNEWGFGKTTLNRWWSLVKVENCRENLRSAPTRQDEPTVDFKVRTL